MYQCVGKWEGGRWIVVENTLPKWQNVAGAANKTKKKKGME
jgi:hypothetical protein